MIYAFLCFHGSIKLIKHISKTNTTTNYKNVSEYDQDMPHTFVHRLPIKPWHRNIPFQIVDCETVTK